MCYCVTGQVVSAIELVGTYCISLKELQDILSYLYTGRGESWVSDTIGTSLTLASEPHISKSSLISASWVSDTIGTEPHISKSSLILASRVSH